MMKNMLWMAVAGVLFLSGCNTNDEMECPQPISGPLSATEQTVSGNWVLTALEGSFAIDLTDDDTDNASTNLLGQLSDCRQIARYEFNADREMNYIIADEVEEVCEEELVFSGTWKSDGEVMTVVVGCATARFAIVEEEGVKTISYNTYEQVFNFQGETIPMQVFYTYTFIPDAE